MLRARGEQLCQRIHGGFALAGPDDGPGLLVGVGMQGVFCGGPGGAVAAEHDVVFDGEFEAGAGEFALDGSNRRKATAIRKLVEIIGGTIGIERRLPAGFVETIDRVIEVHDVLSFRENVPPDPAAPGVWRAGIGPSMYTRRDEKGNQIELF
jgi:hypothetical protein